MGKVFDLNGEDLTKTDTTLRVPEEPADAAEVGKRNDAQTKSLNAETSRAEGAEKKLQQQVDTLNAGGLNLKEDLIRTQVDSYLTQHPEAMGTALAEETTRAKAAEEENAKGIGQLKEDLDSQKKRLIKYKNQNNLLPFSELRNIETKSDISVVVGTSETEKKPTYDEDGLGIVPLSSGKALFFTIPIDDLFDGKMLFSAKVANSNTCSLALQAYTKGGGYLGNIVANDGAEKSFQFAVEDVKNKYPGIEYVRFQIANSTRFEQDVIYVTQPYFGVDDDLHGAYWIDNLKDVKKKIEKSSIKIDSVPVKTKNNIINYSSSFENTSFYPANVLYQNYYDDALVEKKGEMLRTDTVVCNQGNLQIIDKNIKAFGESNIDYNYFHWCEVNPSKDTYDFSPISSYVQKSYNNKRRVILRIFPSCSPYVSVGENYVHEGVTGRIAFPRYVAELLERDNSAQWIQSYKGYWDLDINPEYVYSEYQKLVENFGSWFDAATLNDGTLVKNCVLFIQIGLIGAWGEGYSYNLKATASVDDLLRYTKLFVDNIPDKILSIGSTLRTYDSNDALKWNELFFAEKELSNSVGYVGHFIDNFGSRNKKFFDDAKFTDDEDSNFTNIFSKYVERGDFFNGEFALFFNTNNWGKNIGQWSYDLIKFLKPGFLRVPELSVSNGGKKYNIKNSCAFTYAIINSIVSCIGFRFVYAVYYANVSGDKLDVDIGITNIGTGRLYFDLYDVYLRIIDGNSDGNIYSDIKLPVSLVDIHPVEGNEPLQYGFGNGKAISSTVTLPYSKNIVKIIAKDKLGFEPMYFSNYERDKNGCYPVYED